MRCLFLHVCYCQHWYAPDIKHDGCRFLCSIAPSQQVKAASVTTTCQIYSFSSFMKFQMCTIFCVCKITQSNIVETGPRCEENAKVGKYLVPTKFPITKLAYNNLFVYTRESEFHIVRATGDTYLFIFAGLG